MSRRGLINGAADGLLQSRDSSQTVLGTQLGGGRQGGTGLWCILKWTSKEQVTPAPLQQCQYRGSFAGSWLQAWESPWCIFALYNIVHCKSIVLSKCITLPLHSPLWWSYFIICFSVTYTQVGNESISQGWARKHARNMSSYKSASWKPQWVFWHFQAV